MKLSIRDIRRKLFHYSVAQPDILVKLFDENISISEASEKLFNFSQSKILNFTKHKTSISIS